MKEILSRENKMIAHFTDWQAMQTCTAMHPADAENLKKAKEKLYANGSSIHIEFSYFPFTWHRSVF